MAEPKIYFNSKSNKEEEGSAANKEEKEFLWVNITKPDYINIKWKLFFINFRFKAFFFDRKENPEDGSLANYAVHFDDSMM